MVAIVGYARVSMREQNPAQQEALLRAAGVERVFIDHGESSRKASRPQLNACLDYMRPGDVLLVNSLDRLGNDTHLITLINDFGERGIDLRSLTEPAIDTTSPMGRALYGIMAVLAQLRVDTIRANTRSGLAYARSQGRVGGRPTVMTADRISVAVAMREQGATIEKVATTLGVGTATVKRALKRHADAALAGETSVTAEA